MTPALAIPLPASATRRAAAGLTHTAREHELMDLKKLLGLRPKDDSVDAIRTALVQAQGVQSAASQRAAELEAGRARMLVDGSAGEVERAERDLTAARGDAERAGAMIVGLQGKLAEAEAREAERGARQAVVDAEARRSRFLAFVRNDYPALAQKIADGLKLEAEAEAASMRAMNAIMALPSEVRDKLASEGVQSPAQPAADLPLSFHRPGGFGVGVRLPAVADSGAIWR